jgi:hypothetical protein
VALVCLAFIVGVSSLSNLMKNGAAGSGRTPATITLSDNGVIIAPAAPSNAIDVTKATLAGDPRVAALAGDWIGPEGDCDDAPMRIDVSSDAKLKVRSGHTHADTAIEGVGADGAVQVASADGVWSYAVAGKTLTMTPPKGPKLVFTRCDD